MFNVTLKRIARKPIVRACTCVRYGYVIVSYEKHLCPLCKNILNAGPNYQPKYCDQCGQRIDFKGTKWVAEQEIGKVPLEERKGIGGVRV